MAAGAGSSRAADDTEPAATALERSRQTTTAATVAWLGWLAVPAIELVTSARPIVAIVAGFAGLAVLAISYVRLMLWCSTVQPGRFAFHFVAMLAVVAVGWVLLGGSWPVLVIYVAVVLASAVPTIPRALAAVIALGAAVTLASAADGWSRQGVVAAVLTFGLGLSLLGWRQLVTTIAELRRARHEAARLALAEERVRIARDLHDLLGRSLTAISLKTELAGRLMPKDPAAAARQLDEIGCTAQASLREVRHVLAAMRSGDLHAEASAAASLLAAAGIEANVDIGVDALPEPVDAVVTCLVREGVTNVVRHSRAAQCRISVQREREGVIAEVEDDGLNDPALTTHDADGGHGLIGLEERARAIGGDVEVQRPSDGGFVLRARLPVEPSVGAPPLGQAGPADGHDRPARKGRYSRAG